MPAPPPGPLPAGPGVGLDDDGDVAVPMPVPRGRVLRPDRPLWSDGPDGTEFKYDAAYTNPRTSVPFTANYILRCGKADHKHGCRRKRHDVEAHRAKYGDIEPLAYLLAWKDTPPLPGQDARQLSPVAGSRCPSCGRPWRRTSGIATLVVCVKHCQDVSVGLVLGLVLRFFSSCVVDPRQP